MIRRLLLALVSLTLGCTGALHAAGSSVAATDRPAQTSTHDGLRPSSAASTVTTKRGPPSANDRRTTCPAVDCWSHGASARSGVSTSPPISTDNIPAPLVQVARAAGTTAEQAWDDDGAVSALAPRDVAAETVPSGLPRDALGRFTSGAGGESAAAAAGRTAHANYANTLGGGDYVFNRALPDSLLRPDAVSYSQNIVRELKPATPSAIARGWRQVNQYKAYLEELTGQPRTAYVDTYTP